MCLLLGSGKFEKFQIEICYLFFFFCGGQIFVGENFKLIGAREAEM